MRNIGIRDGHVVVVTPHDLDDTDCPQIIDATGKWVLPGMVDIHTHYDVEVLNGPSLSESLRHGVTTVMVGSCSLDAYAEDRVEQYGDLSRVVNRNDDTVNAVFVGGRAVFLNGQTTDLVGKRRTGRFLRAAHKAPAPAALGVELSSVG